MQCQVKMDTILAVLIFLVVVPNITQAGFNGVPCRGQCSDGTFCSSECDYCKCLPGLIQRTENNGSFTCATDIDECELKIFDCPSESVCVNSHGGYRCVCADGLYKTFDGYCRPDIDECSLGIASCPENTGCRNTLGYYTCICSGGFTRAENGTCIRVDGVPLAWYWWVGIVIASFVGIVILLAIARCACNRCDDDEDSSAGDLRSDRLTEIYTDKDDKTTNKLMPSVDSGIERPKHETKNEKDRTIVRENVPDTGPYSTESADESTDTVAQSLLSN